jgi:hypothetical protein
LSAAPTGPSCAPVQHNTTQHNTTQHNTTQHNKLYSVHCNFYVRK